MIPDKDELKNIDWIAEKVWLDKKTHKLYLWLKTDCKSVEIFTEDNKHFGIDLTSNPQ